MTHLVELRNLGRSFTVGGETVEALSAINLEIKRGEFVALVGASGSGKSTLMNNLGCLDAPTAGTYLLAGQDVSLLVRTRSQCQIDLEIRCGWAACGCACPLPRRSHSLAHRDQTQVQRARPHLQLWADPLERTAALATPHAGPPAGHYPDRNRARAGDQDPRTARRHSQLRQPAVRSAARFPNSKISSSRPSHRDRSGGRDTAVPFAQFIISVAGPDARHGCSDAAAINVVSPNIVTP